MLKQLLALKLQLTQEHIPNGGNKTGSKGPIREAQEKATLPHTCKDI